MNHTFELLLTIGIPILANIILLAFMMGKFSNMLDGHKEAMTKVIERLDHLYSEVYYLKGWAERDVK